MAPCAAVSQQTLNLIARRRLNPALIMKRAALFFEDIVFHPQGTGVGQDDSLFDLWSSKEKWLSAWVASDDEEREFLLSSGEFSDLFTLSDSLIDDPEVLYQSAWRTDELDWMSNRLIDYAKDIVKQEHDVTSLDELDYKKLREVWEDQKRMIGHLQSDFGFYYHVSAMEREVVGMFTPYHTGFMETISDRGDQQAWTRMTVQSSEISIVDVGALTWSDVLDLRNSFYLDDFRVKIQDAMGKDGDISDLHAEAVDAMLDLASEIEPEPKLATAKAVLGNLPNPFFGINPFSMASDVSQIREELNLAERYGWIFFLADAHGRTCS